MKTKQKNFAENNLQKTVVAILCISFFITMGCEENKNDINRDFDALEECVMPSMSGMALDCYVSSFLEGASECSKCSNVYIIKGMALDSYEYGLNIKLVEDLGGNFPKNINTFIAWGDGNSFLCSNRLDRLDMYSSQDVLIMLLTPARELPADMIPDGNTWLEKPGDYTTLVCTASVLKLSGGYVTGFIEPNNNKKSDETFLTIMSWKDFQKKLKKALQN